MSTINERLKQIRVCSRKSQSEFGKILNVSAQLISKWECTDFTPSIEDINNISQKFNISLDYIINGNTIDSDRAFLERVLTKEELDEELKKEFSSTLSKTELAHYIPRLISCAKISDKVFVQNIDIKEKIQFDNDDIVQLANFDLYKVLSKKYIITGSIGFEQLNPNIHSLAFYEEALKNDADNVENTFLKYTSEKSLWNDKVILWLINHGAVCIEFNGMEEEVKKYVLEGAYVYNNTYKPIYKENLILTFLLKSELERKTRE